MVLNDTLANAMISIKNSSMIGHNKVVIKNGSKMIREVLKVMQKNNYVGDFEEISDIRGTQFVVKLTGRINNCKAIKPRFPVNRKKFRTYEKQYLPAQNVGLLIMTTPQGVMSVDDAKDKNTGGRLLAFVY